MLFSRLNLAMVTVSVLLMSLFAVGSQARTFDASSCDAIKNALNRASSGDEVTVADGTYNCGSLGIRASGSLDEPIIIRAQNKGKAIFRDGTKLTISGSYVNVSGFVWNNSGILIHGHHNEVYANWFRHGNRGSVNSAVYIDGGRHNRVSYNEIGPWKTYGIRVIPNRGSAISNILDHNHIHHITGEKRNGSEGIQVGMKRAHSPKHLHTIIEYNLIGPSVDIDGETISIKSSSNVVRYNTFLDANSGPTQRHGQSTEWYGNTFVGMKYGLRIYGNNHKVVSNRLRNTELHVKAGDITLSNFESVSSSKNKHPAAFGTVVAHNEASGGAIIIGERSYSGIPARETRVTANKGSVVYRDERDTVKDADYNGDVYKPVELSPKDVGPDAYKDEPPDGKDEDDTDTGTDGDSEPAPFTSIYFNAGGPEYQQDGITWQADPRYEEDGFGYVTEVSRANVKDYEIRNADIPILYQTHRWAEESKPLEYRVTVPPGFYDIELKWGETWATGPNQRVMQVMIEDEIVGEYDIWSLVGRNRAFYRIFRAVPVDDGVLNLNFLSVVQNPMVSAISVRKVEPAEPVAP